MKVICIAWLFLALTCLPLFADSATFDINVSNGAITPTASSYGTISAWLNADGTISFTVNMAPGYLIGGAMGPLLWDSTTPRALMVRKCHWQVSLASVLPSGYNFSCCNAGQVNGFGSFLGNVTGPNAASSVSTLAFTLSTTQIFSGSTPGFTSVYQLISLSTGGAGDGNQDFAVHVVPTATNGKTGYAGTSTLGSSA